MTGRESAAFTQLICRGIGLRVEERGCWPTFLDDIGDSFFSGKILRAVVPATVPVTKPCSIAGAADAGLDYVHETAQSGDQLWHR
jgi:hypothetical protein